ncbi:hypothetical protein BB559_003752 [Furculomyces boomerangus]|uniref:Glycosylphosphatidylinositol anchor biosynthesis protein 11 n=2 Tax=Harpellales TaxID=61421 RepID=A0A2T9YJ40_9FUNG|nr:hypothetical protein BB559_003752 [Furculomyces boomerangus]PWA02517.1 hypothetical protein BB558_001391 [Smittium angustum]
MTDTKEKLSLIFPGLVSVILSIFFASQQELYNNTNFLLLEISVISVISHSVANYFVLLQQKTKNSKTKNIFLETIQNALKHFYISIATSFFLFVVAVLLGAPLFSDYNSTFIWAFNTALLSTSAFSWTFTFEYENLNIAMGDRMDTLKAQWVFFSLWGSLLGSWLSAFVIPLDWDRPWQKWPIPGFLGAHFGYLISIVLFLILSGTIKEYHKQKGSKIN